MAKYVFIIQPRQAGQPLAHVLRGELHRSTAEIQRLVESRQVWVNGKLCLELKRRLPAGARLEVSQPDQGHLRCQGEQPVIRYLDRHIVVVDKPPGLTTMRHAGEAAEFGARSKRFLPPTLADFLPDLIAAKQPGKPGRVRAVHRLDKETSGLVVFARTPEAESRLGKQFRAHTIERRYLAVVRGQAQEGKIESSLIEDRGDGRRGSAKEPGRGKRAVTHVRIVEPLGNFTLVECRLETGRTHQVRIHLGEAGTPICGERIYDRPLHSRPYPDPSGCKRVALHAATLGLVHPASGERKTWTSPLPKDMAELVKRLRRKEG
ncbi:MAG: RluA family pseudouridine synthase [Gemmataceae bacterium]